MSLPIDNSRKHFYNLLIGIEFTFVNRFSRDPSLTRTRFTHIQLNIPLELLPCLTVFFYCEVSHDEVR